MADRMKLAATVACVCPGGRRRVAHRRPPGDDRARGAALVVRAERAPSRAGVARGRRAERGR